MCGRSHFCSALLIAVAQIGNLREEVRNHSGLNYLPGLIDGTALVDCATPMTTENVHFSFPVPFSN
jgi:hypothetical protein